VLHGASTTTPNLSLRSARNLADARGRFGIVTTGLRECRVGRPSSLPDSSSSVCHDTSAWMTHRLCSSDRITDALVNLRWLRIPERIQFKVAVLVYKVLHGLASQYLGPLTHVSNLPGRRTLRSACTNPLDISFV